MTEQESITQPTPRTTHHAPRITRPQHRRLFLFLTLLLLAILLQVIVLGWRAETVFFVTWLLAALTVQHDGRLSAGVGLGFLATVPLLLLADQKGAAEQTAIYAFYFLAIGVVVQIEEVVLARFGWLDRKLDLAYLWRPVDQALQRAWSAAIGAVGRLQAAADRRELVRLVQILGAAGLATVFLWAVLSGAPASVVAPLLGGAILFPFLVWGVWLILRAMGPAWVLRVLLALALLVVMTFTLAWLYDLGTADRLARMETAYDFVENLDRAQHASPPAEGEAIEARAWAVEGEARRVLYQHPAFAGSSRVAYTVPIGEGYLLAFELSTNPDSWLLPGDGVTFTVYVESDQGTDQVFSTYINPKEEEADRRWHPAAIDLGAYAGQTVTIIFETGTGPAGDYRYDWAGWGTPRLLEP